MAPFPAVGTSVPVLRNITSEEGSGFVSALAGDMVRLLHIGSGETDKGWAFIRKLNPSAEEGWIHVALLMTPATYAQDSSPDTGQVGLMGKTEAAANAFQHMHIIIMIGSCRFERKGICTENAAIGWAHHLRLIYTESSVSAEMLFTGRIFRHTVSAAIILNAPMDQEVGSLDLPSLRAFQIFAGMEVDARTRLSYLDLCFLLADPWCS